MLPPLVWGAGVQIPYFETFIGDVALGINATSAQAAVHSGQLALVPWKPDSPPPGWFPLVLRGDRHWCWGAFAGAGLESLRRAES